MGRTSSLTQSSAKARSQKSRRIKFNSSRISHEVVAESSSRPKRPRFVRKREKESSVTSNAIGEQFEDAIDDDKLRESSNSPLIKPIPPEYELSFNFDIDTLMTNLEKSSEIKNNDSGSDDHVSETRLDIPAAILESDSLPDSFEKPCPQLSIDHPCISKTKDIEIEDSGSCFITDSQVQAEINMDVSRTNAENLVDPAQRISKKRRKLESRALLKDTPAPVAHSSQLKGQYQILDGVNCVPESIYSDPQISNSLQEEENLESSLIPSQLQSSPVQNTECLPIMNATTATLAATTTRLNGSASYLHSSFPSQLRLIKFLQLRDLPAQSLSEFLFDKDLNQYWESDPKFDDLTSKLVTYVVHPRFPKVDGPSKMPLRHKKLCSDLEVSTEDYLVEIWKLMSGGKWLTPNSANEELYQGPWFELSECIGREWVTFLALHCCLYRPWDSGSEKWIEFTSQRFAWKPISSGTPSVRAVKESQSEYVSKQVIMFRSKCLAKPQYPDLVYRFQLKEIEKLINISMKNIDKMWHKWNHKLLIPHSVNGWTPFKKVTHFVKSCLREIFPSSLLGSKSNQHSFFESVHQYIKTPGFNKTSVSSLLKNIRLKEIPWMHGKDSNPQEHIKILTCLLKWIIEDIVNPLLVSHFYITEMSGNPRTIFYYPHAIWIKNYLEPSRKELIERLGGPQNIKTLENPIGERVRFVPKQDGSTRPIINMKKLNENMKASHMVLQRLMKPSRTRLNSWQEWGLRLYEFKSRYPSTTKFYIARCDISGCYDNANIEKVKVLLKGLLVPSQGLFRIQTLKAFDCSSEAFKYVTASKLLQAKGDSKFFDLNTLDKLNSNTPVKDDFNQENKSPRISLVSETSYSHLTIEEVARAIDDILNHLVLRISKNQSIPFKQGIPQGSVCSLDLCNILLDDLVDEHLSEYTDSKSSMLLRYVDDFLFVTTDKQLAEKYLLRMKQGFKHDYGVWCKEEKLYTNLNTSGERTAYLGLDFDTDTLEIEPQNSPPFNVKLNGPNSAKNHEYIASRLAIDMNRILGLLRSFSRANVSPPPKLVWKVASVFGTALAHRFDAYCLLAGRLHESTSPNVVFSEKVNKLFIRLIPKDLHPRAKKVINSRFKQEMKKNKIIQRKFQTKKKVL